MLAVGIPKEIKPREKRVGLTPSAVARLCKLGIKVYAEKDAGLGSEFSNQDYVASGAEILPDARSIYTQSDLIQKVKEPLPPEYELLKRGQFLFCFLHLASHEHCRLVRVLMQSGVTAIGYETVEKEGCTPLLAPMSEIAGGLAACYAGFFRAQKLVKRGKVVYPSGFQEDLEVIATNYPAVPQKADIGAVVIFGGGVAGTRALEVSLGIGGVVTVVEKDAGRRKNLERENVRVISPDSEMMPTLQKSDVLIGCVHAPGKRAHKVFDQETLRTISSERKKVVMDVSIDQGGNFPEAHSTTYDDPVYLDSFGNLRFGVANIPSLCGREASEALSRVVLPYTEALAKDPGGAFAKMKELRDAINVQEGVVKLDAIREAHRL